MPTGSTVARSARIREKTYLRRKIRHDRAKNTGNPVTVGIEIIGIGARIGAIMGSPQVMPYLVSKGLVGAVTRTITTYQGGTEAKLLYRTTIAATVSPRYVCYATVTTPTIWPQIGH